MPSKRPSPVVTLRLLSGGISAEKTSSPSSTLLPVRLRWAAGTHDCHALLDLGAEGNFMDRKLAHKLHIPVTTLTHSISVNTLNGQSLPSITLTTKPITLTTSGNHTETLSLILLNSPLAPVVLGHPWLALHNPRVDWCLNSISAWSTQCYKSCLASACQSVPVSVFQEEAVDLSNVPVEYLDLKEVFSKSCAASLPPHRPYDCAIDILPGYIVSSEGLCMDPDKVKAVVEWPSPDSRKALQRLKNIFFFKPSNVSKLLTGETIVQQFESFLSVEARNEELLNFQPFENRLDNFLHESLSRLYPAAWGGD
ncbi:hypothetical protein PO909_029502 [Leuciscus waleckii]